MASPNRARDQQACGEDNPGAGVACLRAIGCATRPLTSPISTVMVAAKLSFAALETVQHVPTVLRLQECVYETRRSKPGIKSGVIENIQRRLDAIEQRLNQEPLCSSASTTQDDRPGITTDRVESPAETVLALLANELPKLIASSKQNVGSSQASTRVSSKRRRLNSTTIGEGSELTGGDPPLPSFEAIGSYIDTYFTHVHPWIPMLNQDRFRQRVEDPSELPRLKVILQAIVMIVSRYLPDELGLKEIWPVEKIRKWTILRSMESNTLEGLQALIIIAFDDIGSGNADRAWAIIASLSRTVEFLQLTMDLEDDAAQPICRPFSYLGPAKDWADQEERRRVFWNVFLLDRFCSITMGWNTSLTSIDVHQRLPCDGILWRKQEAVQTPYLGIWDKSTGGMENMAASRTRRDVETPDQTDRRAQLEPDVSENDMSQIGAFAYSVEATESMSRVTAYFLQHRFNPNNPEAVNAWLARFKELDLRLVQWKMFLPKKWNSRVLRQASRMDPNLTLAHVIHNASTILLHQIIAWPRPSWPFRKRLPSVWSADTCCSAGLEISTIARKYLESTPDSLPITSPFAFCLYIAARMLLIHWKSDPSNDHLDDFESMTQSLEEISRRWNGASKEGQPKDLAFKYAAKLKGMYRRCQEDQSFTIVVSDYTQEMECRIWDHMPASVTERRNAQQWPNALERQGTWQSQLLAKSTASYPPRSSPVQYQEADRDQGSTDSTSSGNLNDAIGMVSEQFMPVEEYFMDMDRVIAFNDGSLFIAGMENEAW
ncbi:x-pro dipeptidyl-peptidase [Fusarium mundagurra]|uniref:X-pro dipeptidyl-peptidase n=1 Tax=Fusarium mundagurra TaxID=1567541 RepID=A0A8H5XXR1_9HYPO|nr:x-pro dipeptidyl-peptidase [Fusarium mundagurra]